MLEERAQVIRVDGKQLLVEANRTQGCAKCEAGEGCGGGVLAKLVKRKNAPISVINSLPGIRAGDEVVIGLDETALLRGSLMAYLLPIIGLFCGALLAEWLFSGRDGLVAAMGLLGLATGFLGFHFFSLRAKNDPRYHPVVLRQAGQTVSECHVYSVNKD